MALLCSSVYDLACSQCARGFLKDFFFLKFIEKVNSVSFARPRVVPNPSDV